ncbi:MAG: GMC family oxidoreductase N-terminal domain-containing protein [Steroidobacteraceae bacterium]|nr:GMC family oxidoreductase N-terminal domain-containing protein [Steroidobacteraceae bacterium]
MSRAPAQGEFDYVVVGAGSAGCAVAARLSEDASASVLLVEAGGPDGQWQFEVPGGQVFVRDWTRYAWLYETEPDASRAGRTETWRRGRVLGGSSTINGVIYALGLPQDYARWERAGATGWGWGDVRPYFLRAEHCPGFPERGQSGPVHVEALRSPHAYTADLLAAFAAVGVPVVRDVNAVNGAAVGPAQTNQRRGLRQSSSAAYLRPARGRRNLAILTEASVERVVIEDREARGVVLLRGGRREYVRARREVVLSAGAFGSPQLLMLSGIGPAAHLQALGLPVQVDSPDVGRNLQDHPELYVEYEVRDRTYSSAMRWHRLLATALQYGLTRTGQAISCGTHVLGYARSRPEEIEPDLLLFSGPWGYLEDGFAFTRALDVYSLSPSVCHPRSRGHVELRSPDPAAPPRIVPNLLADPEDVACLLRGVRLVDRIASTPPFARHVIRRLQPAFDLADDAALERFVRDAASICYHACGTCRMGSDPAAVVDPQLRVRGVRRLSIADASVIPEVTSGNLHAPTVMIGERAADLVRARHA